MLTENGTTDLNTARELIDIKSIVEKLNDVNIFTEITNEEDGMDFKDKIKSILTYKKVGGDWSSSTDFQDGDTIKIDIKYSLSDDDLGTDKNKIYYDLPEGIKISEENRGYVLDDDGNNKVGEYTIGTDERVKITFYDEFIKIDAGTTGTVHIEGIVSQNDAGTEGSINFPGSSTTINIVTPPLQGEDKYDISTKKDGYLSDDKSKIDYTIIVSTEKGTSDTVTISDKINGSALRKIDIKQNEDIKVMKADYKGDYESVNDGEYKIKWSDNKLEFKISDLPKLEGGESYKVTYSINVRPINSDNNDEEYYVRNTAYSQSGKYTAHGYEDIGWHKKDIKKLGSYDAKTGLISWKIELNPDKRDIRGWKFEDVVSGEIKGKVMLKRAGGEELEINPTFVENGKSKIVHTFPSNLDDEKGKSKYTLSFQTVATETEKKDEYATNTATFNGQGSTATVTVVPRNYDLDKKPKKSDHVEGNDNLRKNQWQAIVYLPEGDINEFTYKDEILNAVDESGADLGLDSHYAIVSELDGDLKKHIAFKGNDDKDVSKENIDINIEYFDKDNNKINDTGSSARVKSFTITVKAKDQKSFQAKTMNVDPYFTYTDLLSAKPGAKITSKNKGIINKIEKIAEVIHMKESKLLKAVYKDKIDGKDYYEADSTEVTYDGTIRYRLILTTSKSDDGLNLTLTDKLPDKAKFKDKSLRASFYSDKYGDVKKPDDVDGFSFNNNIKYELKDNTLTMKIEKYKFSKTYPKIAIYYELDISQDEYWKNLSNIQKNYVNNVTWGGETAKTNTTVKREPKKVGKMGVQLDQEGNPLSIGSDGNVQGDQKPSGRVRYTVPINPMGEDLDKNSDVLVLKDKFSGNANLQSMLDIDSVKLYRYDSVKEGNRGELVDESNYTLKYDSFSKELTMRIPDKKGLILEYEYSLDITILAENVNVSNEVMLNGEWLDRVNTVIKKSTSGATASKNLLKYIR